MAVHRRTGSSADMSFSGMFGLAVNTTLFIVLFIITFIVLDVFYPRDISYWGMTSRRCPPNSHERSTYTALGTFTGSIGYNGITVIVIPIVTFQLLHLDVHRRQGRGRAGDLRFIIALSA